jgi:hypothetical protein
VWTDAGDEVLLDLAALRVDVRPGCLKVALPLEADELGRERVHVTIAIGRDGRGLLAGAADPPPDDAPPLTARWMLALQGALWAGLLAIAGAPKARGSRRAGYDHGRESAHAELGTLLRRRERGRVS